MYRHTSRRVAIIAIALAVALSPTAYAHAADVRLWLNFDNPPNDQADILPWTTGCFANAEGVAAQACITAGGGGSLTPTIRPSGESTSPALKFPMPNSGTAVVIVSDQNSLNPGTADFTLTAMVKLTSAEVSVGANLVQKGLFSTTGGQWKLQIDNGIPSCRIAGTNPDETAAPGVLVRWAAPITDIGWSYISCKRRGDELSISVDDATPVTTTGATMNIANTADVRIGAKGTGTNNDQFHGAIDNVRLTMN